MTKLKHRRFEVGLVKGGIYSGRCAGGAGRAFGGEYIIIAADNKVLAKVWEALEGVPIREDIVYDVTAGGTAKLESILNPTEPK